MIILLWVLQIILALHTIMGAVWKFSNSEQTVPSLKAIPHGVWLAMGVIEMFCGLCLILPAFNKRLTILGPYRGGLHSRGNAEFFRVAYLFR